MTAKIYDFSTYFNERFMTAARRHMSLTVAIDKENLRASMRILSRLFPEMSPLESDSGAIWSLNDFNQAANPVTGVIQYGEPFMFPEKSLRVTLNDAANGATPLFTITAKKPQSDGPLVLPTSWGRQGPYIVVSDSLIVEEPKLLGYLRAFSDGSQSSKYEPLRSKIARAMGGEIRVKEDAICPIATMTLASPANGFVEMRLR